MTVFVIGAGASIAHTEGGYPAIDTIFKRATELGLLGEPGRPVTEEFAQLAEYIDAAFAKRITDRRIRLDFQDFLTLLDRRQFRAFRHPP
jgi:hypothetical protein